jgi:hypothetical protein
VENHWRWQQLRVIISGLYVRLMFYTTFNDKSAMLASQQWVIVAAVPAFALLGIISIQTIMVPQSAEVRGCQTSIAFNASQGRSASIPGRLAARFARRRHDSMS